MYTKDFPPMKHFIVTIDQSANFWDETPNLRSYPMHNSDKANERDRVDPRVEKSRRTSVLLLVPPLLHPLG